jgi:hypothetical protein
MTRASLQPDEGYTKFSSATFGGLLDRAVGHSDRVQIDRTRYHIWWRQLPITNSQFPIPNSQVSFVNSIQWKFRVFCRITDKCAFHLDP